MTIALPLLALAAAASAQVPTATETPRPAPGAETQARLDRIARGCKLKKGTFTIREDGLVDTHEPVNSTREKMNCAYAELAKVGFQPPADASSSQK